MSFSYFLPFFIFLVAADIPLPCDQASDFDGERALNDQLTCQGLAAAEFTFLIPSSAAQCSDTIPDGSETKAEALKNLHSLCCKPGSKVNEVCGSMAPTEIDFSSIPLPCDQASDFDAQKAVDDRQTCQDLSNIFGFLLPSSAAQCSETLPDSTETKAEALENIHSMCCKPGSKMNEVCGPKKTMTPTDTDVSPTIWPCDQPSDFIGTRAVDSAQTCQDVAAAFTFILPSSVTECDEKLPESPETKGEALKNLHNLCCKAGSKMNEVCASLPSEAICPKCGKFKKSGTRSCCAPGGTWNKNCGDDDDSKVDHTWFEGIEVCKDDSGISAPVQPPVSSNPFPCDQASDFTGTKVLNDGQTCQDLSEMFTILVPSSAAQCNEKIPGSPEIKGDVLKNLHSMCCKPGSKVNKVCGATAPTDIKPSEAACPKCGLFKKSGINSCCASGGSWNKKCGNDGDSKFDHTWFEGIEACKSKFSNFVGETRSQDKNSQPTVSISRW